MTSRPTTLGELLTAAAEQAPDTTAIVDANGSLTFEELLGATLLRASLLTALDLGGQRVALISENSADMVAQIYANALAGVTTIFINARLQPHEQVAQLRRSGAALWIGDDHAVDGLSNEIGETTDVQLLSLAAARPASLEQYPHPVVRAEDPAWLLYTSGTTGRSKGVVLTHANVVAAAENAGVARRFSSDEVLGLPFPLFHIAATNLLIAHLNHRPVVLISGFEPAEVATLIERYKITALSLAPTMVRRLIDYQRRAGADLSSLRTVYYGAAPITPALLREAHDVLGCEFSQSYGMTEAAGMAVFLDADAHRRGLAGEPERLTQAGMPGPHITLRIVDDDGNQVPPGIIGEISLSGPQIFSDYDEESDVARAERCRSGGFRSGDMGVIDANGALRVVDRKKDIIITGGENVSSLEVEAALCSHPSISAAAVVSRPDPEWGEAIVAAVVPTDGTFDEGAVRAFCRDALAGFKRPKTYLVVDALPVNATGKIDKVAIRRLARGEVH